MTATAQVERRLAALVAADVVGYSRLMERDEAGTLARLRAYSARCSTPLFAEYRGRVVNFPGDSALCEFASVIDAVECAVAIQCAMAEREGSVPRPSAFASASGSTPEISSSMGTTSTAMA